MTDEQTINQLKTQGAIHDAIFGKPADTPAIAGVDDEVEAPAVIFHDCPNCGGHTNQGETT